MKIHAALMTQNELSDLTENLRRVLPFVDTVTVVDGGSTDGTIPYMRNWSRVEPKLRYFIHPWADNFPEQRNNYLRRVGEVAKDGDWMLAFDPDEVLDENGLEALRSLASDGERFGHGKVGFQCRSVSYRGPERVHTNVDQYWKFLFVRWAPSLRYIHFGLGAVHEHLDGMIGGEYRSSYIYEHRKQENVIWPRGFRNYFIGGGGPNLGSSNPRWVELRQLCERLEIRSWAEMHSRLLKGNLDQSIKDWMIKYRQENGWDGSSEQREAYKTYFRLYHPEEEPVELQQEHIP